MIFEAETMYTVQDPEIRPEMFHRQRHAILNDRDCRSIVTTLLCDFTIAG